jgi:hypothetical protein
MSDYQPQAGDRVRVTVEGWVEEVLPAPAGERPTIKVASDDSPSVLAWTGSAAVTVELVERPAPTEEWQPGDVVRNADDPSDGRLWTFYLDGVEDKLPWHNVRSGWNHRSALPANLRLLVRDGQPVSQPEPSHPQPGDVVSEEPPVGSVVRDREGDEWVHMSDGRWDCRADEDFSQGNTIPWRHNVESYAPLTLVRWGAGQ